jgi:acyl-CoA synthetase (AMP-forming)/AMP-acid ligase II
MSIFKRRKAQLPKQPAADGAFVFIDDAGDSVRWSAREHLGRIHTLARHLAAELPQDSPVGLLFRSGPELVVHWLACLHAGLRPLIVQYPTRKQSRAYWYESVTNTIDTAGLWGIVCDDHCAGLGLPERVRLLVASALPRTAAEAAPPEGALLPEQFSILQLSSGTTGYRKAMEFTAGALRRHAEDYNAVLGLDPAVDRIVSWLPLYHDMGYVACFVMPLLLGIEVVMMDPVTWVQSPQLLFEAIAAHRGTVCYMPNFGFEVMCRAPAGGLPSMRYWVSCSEPVSAVTAAKFCAHIGADPAFFAPCYAMAENLFAVTFGSGFETRTIDGAEVVSCGRPIPGVELKTVEGEIWVRSPTSLARYLGGEDIRDEDGFYATGDMGRILDGALFVSGRKQDVLNQAGRKFMLSDVDLRLNEAYPEIRGRAASLALRDERLGTETALILIEAVDFYARTDMAEMAARMVDLTGMDQVEVAYVPPRFLTKTSSGKINRRKTAADWRLAIDARNRAAGPRDPVGELRDAFPLVNWDQPIGDVLDSMSSTIVKITLESTPVRFDPKQSLNQLVATLQAAAAPSAAVADDGIRIVSIGDRRLIARVSEEDLARIGALLGCKVTLEHVCVPPAPVLLSDLVFHDWFQPRLDQEAFANIDDAMERVKGASLLLVEDTSQINFLYASTYPVLSHNLERHEQADLLCYRWQNYSKQHHKLPISLVSGEDIPLGTVSEALSQLSRYLGTPLFRVRTSPVVADYCVGWEHEVPGNLLRGRRGVEGLVASLTAWLEAHPDLRWVTLPPGPPLLISDLAHFCSVMAQRQLVDQVAEHFESFYIAGQPSSLPYLRERLDALGKPYAMISSLTREAIDQVPKKHECLVVCGSWGDPPSDLPVIVFQHIGTGWRVNPMAQATIRLRQTRRGLNDMPPSAADWYCNIPLATPSEADRTAWQRSRDATRNIFW